MAVIEKTIALEGSKVAKEALLRFSYFIPFNFESLLKSAYKQIKRANLGGWLGGSFRIVYSPTWRRMSLISSGVVLNPLAISSSNSFFTL